MSASIRSAVPDDEAAVVALWQACGLVSPPNDPVADFHFARAGAASDVLVATEDGRIVGSIMVGHDGHRGWVYYVSAAPDARGGGVGRSVVEAAEAWLSARGIGKVMLLVRDTNTQVVSWYERLGFEVSPRTVMAKVLR